MGTALAHRIARQRKEAIALGRERVAAQAELAASEERRLRAERLAVVGTLAAGVAHEINNPLSFVRANLGFLDRSLSGKEASDPAEQRELVAESLVGVDRIRRIVCDLQGFTRDDAGQTLVDAAAAVEEALRLSSLRTRGVAPVSTTIASGLPRVHGSHARLVQVLTNLLVNAADAIAEGPAPDPTIRVALSATAAGVRIVVEDGGPGLPPRVREHLFEPFVTTKPPGRGTGLGLPLAREYVAQMGGTIGASDREGGGTRFTIDLPAFGDEPAVTTSAA
jgi:C4-dicarboxylate-specific signal transduction histidine kinase